MKQMKLWALVATLICGASVFTACGTDDNPIYALTPADIAGTWWSSYNESETLPASFTGTEDIPYTKVGRTLVLNADGTGYSATFYFNGEDTEPVYTYGGKDKAPLTFSIAIDGKGYLTFQGDTQHADNYKTWELSYKASQIVCMNGSDKQQFTQATSSENAYITYWLAPKFTDCGFSDIADVFDELKADETVVFLLRHGERGEDFSPAGLLTENGKLQAQLVGRKIRNGEPAFYAHSDYARTKQSCENVAIGRGDAFIHEEWDILDGEYFMRDTAMIKANDLYSWAAVSQWAYEGLYADKGYYNFEERCQEWMNSLRAKLPTMKRINVLVSHDYTVSALTIYASQRQIDLRYWINRKWIHYLTGIAVIIDPQGEMHFRTVRGLNTGYQIK